MTVGREFAETIGLQALGWLAGNAELLPQFMTASGLDASELAERAGEAEFLGAVLDFILMDDGWVREFCDSVRLGYEQPLAARMALPGGEAMHWT